MNTPLDHTNSRPGEIIENNAAKAMSSYTCYAGLGGGFASFCEHIFMLDFWVSCVPPGESSRGTPNLFSPYSRRRYQ